MALMGAAMRVQWTAGDLGSVVPADRLATTGACVFPGPGRVSAALGKSGCGCPAGPRRARCGCATTLL